MRSVLCQRRDQSTGNIHWHLLLEHLSAKDHQAQKRRKVPPKIYLGGAIGQFFAGHNKEIPKILPTQTWRQKKFGCLMMFIFNWMIFRFQLVVLWGVF